MARTTIECCVRWQCDLTLLSIVLLTYLFTYLLTYYGCLTLTDLEIPEFGEGIDDDAEDDVEADGRYEYEERRVVDHEKSELGKRILRRVTHQTLSTQTAATTY